MSLVLNDLGDYSGINGMGLILVFMEILMCTPWEIFVKTAKSTVSYWFLEML